MSGPTAKSKQTSRWGSLLSGAVANLESRLDTFFEEDGHQSSKEYKHSVDQPSHTPGAADTGFRNSSKTAQNHTVSVPEAQSGIDQRQVVSSADSNSASRSVSVGEANEKFGDQPSLNGLTSPVQDGTSTVPKNQLESGDGNESKDLNDATGEVIPGAYQTIEETGLRTEAPETKDSTTKILGEEYGMLSAMEEELERARVDEVDVILSAEEYRDRLSQMQAERDKLETQRQDEIDAHLERIDALQSKLQYLAKETIESARYAIAHDTGDTIVKKLAMRDEQIALLMEEGQKLSKSEVAQLTLVRKLKAKIAEDGKSLQDSKRQLLASQKVSQELLERVRKLEISNKGLASSSIRMLALEKELHVMKVSRDEQQSTAQYLRDQLDSEAKNNKGANLEVASLALEEQRSCNELMKQDFENKKIEQQLREERFQSEIKTLKAELSHEKESKRTADIKMRNEVNVLESQLEAIRTRTEEASSSNSTDSQAKLLRQIETLQSQYALARENWQTLENSLQARVAMLETEKDDVSRVESDTRKRARESSTALRLLQGQLDDCLYKSSLLEHELQENQAYASRLEDKSLQLETNLKEARAQFEQERQTWSISLASRVEEEKVKWRQEALLISDSEATFAQPESPTASLRRTYNIEIPTFASRRGISGRQFSSELSIPSLHERLPSRRSSNKPQRSSDLGSPGILDPSQTTSVLNGAPDTPSIHTIDTEDMFDNDSSPHRTVNDMISVSTAGAGPSVQLVERMSSTVRRLESERAATKDEIARLIKQRDEARNEVVSLMNEVEVKRTLQSKVKELEHSLKVGEERLQTTLEMLGEKSERVEELEADVADLKKIYRELVQTIPA